MARFRRVCIKRCSGGVMIAFRKAISASICLVTYLASAVFAGSALAQSAVTAPPARTPPMQVVPDSCFDPVARVNVSGPPAMQVMSERGRSGEAVVVVTPIRSIPAAGRSVNHQRSATRARAIMVAGSSVPPLRYRPGPVSEPMVTITPSTH